jgi:hypothetical protein
LLNEYGGITLAFDQVAGWVVPELESFRYNNGNTFAWSGPSGVGGCTGQAPEQATHPSVSRLSRCAIEPADSMDRKKTPQGKRLRPRFGEGLPFATHVSRLTPDRRPLVFTQLRTGRLREGKPAALGIWQWFDGTFTLKLD